jgi:hypothetical protein
VVKARKFLAGVFATALMAVGVAGPATAANQEQTGLVNVQIGDIMIRDVNVAVAANIVATVCAIAEVDALVLAQQVDASGTKELVCRTDGGPVRIRQD